MAKPIIASEAIYTLPEAIETQVGQIVVRYAHLEDILRMTIWEFIEVDHSFGRVVTREPDLRACIEAIRDLAFMRKYTLPDDWTKISKGAIKLGEKRNLVVHGSWLPGPDNKLYVMDTRGSYRPDARLDKVPKRIEPTGVEVSVYGLQSIAKDLAYLIKRFSEIHVAVAAKFSPSP